MEYRTCTHICDNGSICNSAAVTDRNLCLYHLDHRARLMRMAQYRARNERFDLKLPPLESMHAVQSALNQLSEALAADMIDLKRADASSVLNSLPATSQGRQVARQPLPLRPARPRRRPRRELRPAKRPRSQPLTRTRLPAECHPERRRPCCRSRRAALICHPERRLPLRQPESRDLHFRLAPVRTLPHAHRRLLRPRPRLPRPHHPRRLSRSPPSPSSSARSTKPVAMAAARSATNSSSATSVAARWPSAANATPPSRWKRTCASPPSVSPNVNLPSVLRRKTSSAKKNPRPSQPLHRSKGRPSLSPR